MALINVETVQLNVPPALADAIVHQLTSSQEAIMGAFEDLMTSITSARAATSAEIQGVKDDVAGLQTTLADQATLIADLQAQLAAGLGTAAELAAAKAKLDEIEAKSADAKAVVDSMTSDLAAVDVVPGSPAPPTP